MKYSTPPTESLNYFEKRYDQLLAHYLCRENLKTTQISFTHLSYRDHTRLDIAHAIVKSLNRHRPISVGYDHGALLAYGKIVHQAVVVGKKRVNNTCQVLVRNSWGDDFFEDFTSNNSESIRPGHFWVDLSDLMQSVKKVRYIDK